MDGIMDGMEMRIEMRRVSGAAGSAVWARELACSASVYRYDAARGWVLATSLWYLRSITEYSLLKDLEALHWVHFTTNWRYGFIPGVWIAPWYRWISVLGSGEAIYQCLSGVIIPVPAKSSLLNQLCRGQVHFNCYNRMSILLTLVLCYSI